MVNPEPQHFSAAEHYPIRVLVVDDSAFMRYTISNHLNNYPEIKVVGCARNGEEALDLIPKLDPGVVTLDVEMPKMNGLDTLRQIMANFPRPVIMLSSLTTEGAAETIQALTLGAVDFVAKPALKANIKAVMDDVASKIITSAQAMVLPTGVSPTGVLPAASAPAHGAALAAAAVPPLQKTVHRRTKNAPIVLIGASTGGPRALNSVIPSLPADLQAAVVVVQHMPAGFTRSLAERLNSTSALFVKEAEPGDCLETGKALLAPGGFHLTISEQGQVALTQTPPVHGVRPAVDVTLTSLVQRYDQAVISVILTGMGNDGTNGSILLHSAGGWVIAEDESSSVVWGMPRSVIEAGAADVVAPLQKIPAMIEHAVDAYMAKHPLD